MTEQQIEQLKELLKLLETELRHDLDVNDYGMVMSIYNSKVSQIYSIRELLRELAAQ